MFLLVRRMAAALVLVVAVFTTTTRLPASVCPVASAPVGEACQMGCCANKCCCAHSVKSEQAPVPAVKQTEANLELILSNAISASFVVAPIAFEAGQVDGGAAHVVISKTRPALLCTFLI
jgi:hypothetical protein